LCVYWEIESRLKVEALGSCLVCLGEYTLLLTLQHCGRVLDVSDSLSVGRYNVMFRPRDFMHLHIHIRYIPVWQYKDLKFKKILLHIVKLHSFLLYIVSFFKFYLLENKMFEKMYKLPVQNFYFQHIKILFRKQM